MAHRCRVSPLGAPPARLGLATPHTFLVPPAAHTSPPPGTASISPLAPPALIPHLGSQLLRTHLRQANGTGHPTNNEGRRIPPVTHPAAAGSRAGTSSLLHRGKTHRRPEPAAPAAAASPPPCRRSSATGKPPSCSPALPSAGAVSLTALPGKKKIKITNPPPPKTNKKYRHSPPPRAEVASARRSGFTTAPRPAAGHLPAPGTAASLAAGAQPLACSGLTASIAPGTSKRLSQTHPHLSQPCPPPGCARISSPAAPAPEGEAGLSIPPRGNAPPTGLPLGPAPRRQERRREGRKEGRREEGPPRYRR